MNLSVPFHLLIDMKYKIEKQEQKYPKMHVHTSKES